MALQRLLKRSLHDVVVAGSVGSAKSFLEQEGPFDVMISDWGLPDGNGAGILSSMPAEKRPAAIALTGFGMEKDLEASMEAGFRYHLTKPVDFAALLEALAAAAPSN